MARINQALLDRLSSKLGVNKARVYALIQQVSAENRVGRRLGALLLAGKNHISVDKYATEQDLADMRGVPHTLPAAAPTSVSNPLRSVVRKGKPPKTKENTVFVVHGQTPSFAMTCTNSWVRSGSSLKSGDTRSGQQGAAIPT